MRSRRGTGWIALLAAALCPWPAWAGVVTDLELERLTARADQGHARAQAALAVRYEHGEGVAKDITKAIRYYCLAAQQGDAGAQYSLGWIYANGRGVARDDAVAALWFQRAALAGDAYARRMLQRLGTAPGNVQDGCTSARRDRHGASPRRRQIEQWVHELAPQFGLEPRLVLAVITVESLFQSNARSDRNAQGLMQLIPATAERFGVADVWDPVQNLKGGMAYLRWLLALFKGDLRLALAGYNAGERAVEAYRGIPPFAETRHYVEKITQMFGATRHPYGAGVTIPSALVTGHSAAKALDDTGSRPARAARRASGLLNPS